MRIPVIHDYFGVISKTVRNIGVTDGQKKPQSSHPSEKPQIEEEKETMHAESSEFQDDKKSSTSNAPTESKKTGRKRNTLTRKDVMQKTVFRALRKEYDHFFNLFLEYKHYSPNFDVRLFRRYLDEFVEYIMQWEDRSQLESTFGEFRNLQFIIGLMVDFCKIKRIEKTSQETVLMEKFYGSLYKYSHAKFDSLLELPE
mmetsp:Transcript_35515/g.41104  ORF Transcript_35515/g.41104 Transcript_35515/m.41104 type:complete len:199 (-) Transcript_35515:171-767(-)|eukprot:CAMPEP_0168336002 /NCGR_PEP_ID=MMETSP0213-20121227/11267_1 /TAXON_ID=151035 /ORGANISM="Euplotes harpa, Strain FSP1.4" /LENGTH=198 /DNA_ID=CAMNT_0008341081 /DNA_START=442 /DNA_END=1038 /DNA_ORIENTATION=+